MHAGSWNMHVGICNMHVETQHLFLMLARRNAHSVAVSLKFAIKVLPKRSKS